MIIHNYQLNVKSLQIIICIRNIIVYMQVIHLYYNGTIESQQFQSAQQIVTILSAVEKEDPSL